jgi:hypothetical protein
VMGSALVLPRFIIQIGGLVANFDFGSDPPPYRHHREAGWIESSCEIRSRNVSFLFFFIYLRWVFDPLFLFLFFLFLSSS